MVHQEAGVSDFDKFIAHVTEADSLLELSPTQFEHFVQYVFERAGYRTDRTPRRRRHGIDLQVYAPQQKRPLAVDVRRYAAANRVGLPAVMHFRTNLFLRRTRGYLVTTGTFAEPAYRAAKKWDRVSLVSGDRFIRYIRYVLGSRYNPTASGPIPLDITYQADALSLQPTQRTKVLVIANNKGGVGKTTTALYVATEMAKAGKRVLLVDLDAQANLTDIVLNMPARKFSGAHLGDYFAQRCSLQGLVQRTLSPHIDLLPAHSDLRLTDTGGAANPVAELRFAADLHSDDLVNPSREHLPYDWVIVDTPPALTLHTRAALAAAHYVLAPAVPDRFGFEGLMNLLDTMKAMQGLRGTTIQLLGCALTHLDSSGNQYKYIPLMQAIFAGNNSRILKTTIPLDRTLVQTADEGGYWARHTRASDGATAYHNLVQEVLSYVE